MFGQKTQRSYPILGQMTYRSQYWFGTLALPEFDDDTSRGGEKVLEAIQQAWIDEVD